MTEKTVAQKGHIKPGTSIAVIDAAPGVVESLGLPEDVTFVEPDAAQLVMLFARDRAGLESALPATVTRMLPGAVLWVFFRKGSAALGLDMNRDTVWYTAEKAGMRPLGIVGVDDTWSAFRLKQGA